MGLGLDQNGDPWICSQLLHLLPDRLPTALRCPVKKKWMKNSVDPSQLTSSLVKARNLMKSLLPIIIEDEADISICSQGTGGKPPMNLPNFDPDSFTRT